MSHNKGKGTLNSTVAVMQRFVLGITTTTTTTNVSPCLEYLFFFFISLVRTECIGSCEEPQPYDSTCPKKGRTNK